MGPRSRRWKSPSYPNEPPSKSEEGAGKAGCPPHPWSACNKKHAAEPQVQADHPAFPAQWFYGLYVLSPVTIAWLPPSSVRRRKRLHDLSACVGAPEPHDFAVRCSIIRPRKKLRLTLPRPSHPAPNVRDDREPPLFSSAGWRER